MASSNRFDRLQDQMNQKAQSLSDAASSITDQNEQEVTSYAATNTALADGSSAVGSSVSSGNAQQAAATKATATSAYDNENDVVKTIIRHLEHYSLSAGKNKSLTRTEIISLQTMLVRNLEQLVNLESSGDFVVCFRRLLELVRENRTGAFSINMLNRCISALNKGNAFLDNYTKFIDMVVAFSDPTIRSTFIRRYNLVAGTNFAKPQYRERLIEFIRAISGL